MQYIDGIIKWDVLDFEKIHDFKAIQNVLEILRHLVGSLVSYVSIAENCNIAPNTVKKYIQIFEALFIVFRVTPYSKEVICMSAYTLPKESFDLFVDTTSIIIYL